MYDILGTADYFDGDILLEIKTSRKWTVPENPPDHYLDQAEKYAVISGVTTVKIVVIFPTAARKWGGSSSSTLEVVAWDVTFTNDELREIAGEMQQTRDLLDAAWKSKKVEDVAKLPPCPSWKSGSLESTGTQRDGNKTWSIKVRGDFAGMCPRGCDDELQRELDAKIRQGQTRARYAK